VLGGWGLGGANFPELFCVRLLFWNGTLVPRREAGDQRTDESWLIRNSFIRTVIFR
jgi:hypothetical protein